jgi:hypothetical protein
MNEMDIILNVIMLIVILLSAFMPSVSAPGP